MLDFFFTLKKKSLGELAQLGEHFFYTEGVIGSSPIGSTENGLSYNTHPQDRKIARNIIR